MDAYIMTPNFDVVGLIDYAESVILCTKYCAIDDCELYVPCCADALQILVIDNIIFLPGRENIMVIESIELTTDEEKGDFIVAKGYGAETYISRRIVWGQTNLAGQVTECINQLLYDNIINPRQQERKIEHIKIGECYQCIVWMEKQITGDNLLEAAIDMLTTYNLGFKMLYDGEKMVSFCIIKGIDRSVNQSNNPVVEFSEEFDNLLSSEYAIDATKHKNVALVAGEGEGATRRLKEVGIESGINRYEVFVDARDISSQTEGEILTDAQYYNLLAEKGSETLKEHAKMETFTGEVESNGNYQYHTDYNVGDTVTIVNRYGIKKNVRITEALESWSDEGYKCILTFA